MGLQRLRVADLSASRFAPLTWPSSTPCDAFPIALGGIFAAAMAVGLGLGIAMAARTRRRELAVLRTLGFTPASWRAPSGGRRSASSSARRSSGVPIGVAAGRILARSFLGDLGVVATVVTPVLLVVLVIAGALVIGAVAAALPAGAWRRSG